SHDRFGHRIDEVEFHPAWHELMRLAVGSAAHALPWREARPGAHATRAALVFLLNQGENGICCPIAMTFAAVPALRAGPLPDTLWERQALSTSYDPRVLPADEKTGVLLGMALTEKQGGSDVRANTTEARPLGPDGEYLLVGHKWFCSAPTSDAFLVLARTAAGPSCFLVPRFRPDGSRNPFLIQRLKDKLGNRSNASAEVEFDRTWARLVGEDGGGVRAIIPMIHHTRLDAAISSAAIMRQAVTQALHHALHRRAFGRRLADQPLMRAVLADLALESEAATAMVMRLAGAFDEAADESERQPFVRFATAVAKYWTCRRVPAVAGEALECLGGNGYVEESIMPRLYREAPVNAIWEGAGNVICLDALRTLSRVPEALPAFRRELDEAKGGNRRLDAFISALFHGLESELDSEARARWLVERLALAWQGALLVRHAPAAVADAFCAARLSGERGLAFGTLPGAVDCQKIMARAWPPLG
ncbi:MAG: acyl-CoA dehydrogenase family protein, partial [Alphaproteobacteria bacterium]